MAHTLNENEARVIGCLIEKAITTPDQYPLSLNALTNACNQKSSRSPVMSLTQGEVQRTVRDLEANHLVRTEENFKSRTEKYLQRFCNTRFSDYQFDPPQLAIICLLLLRGPQTPGELKARTTRMHAFEDNSAVVASLTTLLEWESAPLVAKLPRTPGRKDSEYMHLLCGAIDFEEYASQAAVRTSDSAGRAGPGELEQRVSRLEKELENIKKQLGIETE